MLNGRNLKTRRPSRKLDHKLHGLFAITTVITRDLLAVTAVPAVRLDLPVKWGCHNTFHVPLVEPYRTSKAALRPELDLAEVLAKANDIDPKEIYHVQEVVGSSWNKRRKKVLYLVIWEGYMDREDWTEEPCEHFMAEGVREALHEFHMANSSAAKDPRVVVTAGRNGRRK